MTKEEKQKVNEATIKAFDENRFHFAAIGPRTIKVMSSCLNSTLTEIEDRAFVLCKSEVDCEALYYEVTAQIKEFVEKLMLSTVSAKKGKISVHTSMPGVKKALDIYHFEKKEKIYKFQ